MKVLVIDIGGTNIKILASGEKEPRKFPSGSRMTPRQMVASVRLAAKDWKYDVVSIGYPGLVVKGRIAAEPRNLAQGWTRFDFRAAFKCPVKIINDAAMQALGSYRKGTMLFLGFGTGIGSALVAEGVLVPMEVAHLSYKNGTYEDYLGLRGLKRLGKKKWRKHVAYCVARLVSAFHLDDVVLGGGNAKNLTKLPKLCRAGDNRKAFLGGFGLWEKADAKHRRPSRAKIGKVVRKVLPGQVSAPQLASQPASASPGEAQT
jgi:polyphosphate glucokinase